MQNSGEAHYSAGILRRMIARPESHLRKFQISKSTKTKPWRGVYGKEDKPDEPIETMEALSQKARRGNKPPRAGYNAG